MGSRERQKNISNRQKRYKIQRRAKVDTSSVQKRRRLRSHPKTWSQHCSVPCLLILGLVFLRNPPARGRSWRDSKIIYRPGSPFGESRYVVDMGIHTLPTLTQQLHAQRMYLSLTCRTYVPPEYNTGFVACSDRSALSPSAVVFGKSGGCRPGPGLHILTYLHVLGISFELEQTSDKLLIAVSSQGTNPHTNRQHASQR